MNDPNFSFPLPKYGALVSFLIIIKDTLPVALGLAVHDHEWIPKLVLFFVALVVILPLSLQRDLAALSFTSVLSVVSVISLLGFVIWYSPMSRTVAENGGYWEMITTDMIKPSFLMGMGIFSDGFACQHAAFVLSGSLHKLTRRRWSIVSASGIGFTCIMFICMGVVGFFGFYDETESDILNNFDAGGFFGRAARFLLAVSMCLAYPIEAFVCRHVLTQIIYGEAEEENREYLQSDNRQQRQRMTLLVFSITMIPGLILDDLGIILALTGTIGATSMAYIGPGLIYLGVFGEEFLYVVSRAFADVVTIFHRGKCVDCTSDSPSSSNTNNTSIMAMYEDDDNSFAAPRQLNDQRRNFTRIDHFLEIQLRQNSSGSTSPSFYYRWVKGNLVSGWVDNM
jgi:amino acid permease